MTQKTDSPDGAAQLLISLLLSSLGRQICLLAFRLAIALTTAAVLTPEGGGLTRGLLPNQSYLPKFPSSKESFMGMILLSLHPEISGNRLGRKLSVKCNHGGGTEGKCALISVTRAISAELWLDETHPLGCNTIPRPQSSSLQDAEVNDEFVARPFKQLSQRALPRSDLPFPPVSFPLFFRSDGRFSGAVSEPR